MSAVRRWTASTAVVMLGTIGVRGPTTTVEQSAPGETTNYEVNGVQVVHRVNPASNVVSVRLYLLGGTRQLSGQTAGIEALLLRTIMLERGRQLARTGSREILEFMPDWSVIGFVGLQDDVDSTWAAFVELLSGPPESNRAIAQARGELMAFARRRYTQPDLRVRDIARFAAFQGHPYEFDPEGTEQSLDALTKADLEHYWEEQAVTSRMLLVVVGSVTRTQVETLVEQALGTLPAGDYEWRLPPPPPERPPTWLTEQRLLPTNYILGYFIGPDPTHRDYFPFRVAVALLSSRVAYQVRARKSLSYTAYAPFLDRGLPGGGIYASTSDPATTLNVMRDEIEGIGSARYLSSTWRGFLDQFTLDELLDQMTTDGQAEAIARAYLYFGDLEMADRYVDRLRRVNLAQVRNIAPRYFRNIYYGFLGDTMLMGGKW
ncbi:MAG TPA: insulinase family protein [Gemmatimonadales bacterium]